MSNIRFVGLDVHADSIAVAVAEPDGEVRSLGVIPNRLEAIRKLVGKLGPARRLKACYEAGPTGYVLYWQLTALGVACEVVAPSLVPVKAGDRVKTDRRDATKLARSYRAGDLTPVWVPDAEHEALRDLVRAREDARQDQHRARHRLSKFLLRHGKRPPQHVKRAWTRKYLSWIKEQVHFDQPALEATLLDYVHEVEHMAERIQRLEQAISQAIEKAPPRMRAVIEALQALRGVAQITAVTVVAELGSLSRFPSPRQLMSYSGLVSSEFSSGNRILRGAITKTGNAHLRRVIIESAWAYQYRPWVGGYLRKRQQGLDPQVKQIAWKAQHRLHRRYLKLAAAGKKKPQIVTAVGRELLGFIWAIAVETEAKFEPRSRVAQE
ncbi:MAG: IS110 family transposase [Bryobacterales bacterium]|nr:IS110 family transposase [Bryobacteraceae bacterium]MDW8354163.1 IS110 family transposase [Bryobacterales bacterium]